MRRTTWGMRSAERGDKTALRSCLTAGRSVSHPIDEQDHLGGSLPGLLFPLEALIKDMPFIAPFRDRPLVGNDLVPDFLVERFFLLEFGYKNFPDFRPCGRFIILLHEDQPLLQDLIQNQV